MKNIKLSLLLLSSLGVMSGITVVSSLPLISQTFSNIQNIEFLSKLMIAIPSLIIAIFAPFAGYVVDRFGRLLPLYKGMFLFILGGTSGFYINNFYYILLGRAILGVGVALIMTSTTTLIADYFNQYDRHKFMSMQGMSIGISGIVFIVIGGLLAQIHWSYPFAVYFVPILFFPFLIYHLYEPKKYEKEKENDNKNTANLFPVYLTAFFAMVLFYMLPTQLPYFIVDTLGGKPQSIGFVIATAMVFNAVIAMKYSKIKEVLSYLQIYIITFVFFAFGLLIISQVNTLAQLYLSTIFLGTAFGLLLVNTNSWFLSKVPANKRGKASGIFTSSLFFGQFSSPIIFEPLINLYGIQGLFLIISIISFIVVFILLYYKKKYV